MATAYAGKRSHDGRPNHRVQNNKQRNSSASQQVNPEKVVQTDQVEQTSSGPLIDIIKGILSFVWVALVWGSKKVKNFLASNGSLNNSSTNEGILSGILVGRYIFGLLSVHMLTWEAYLDMQLVAGLLAVAAWREHTLPKPIRIAVAVLAIGAWFEYRTSGTVKAIFGFGYNGIAFVLIPVVLIVGWLVYWFNNHSDKPTEVIELTSPDRNIDWAKKELFTRLNNKDKNDRKGWYVSKLLDIAKAVASKEKKEWEQVMIGLAQEVETENYSFTLEELASAVNVSLEPAKPAVPVVPQVSPLSEAEKALFKRTTTQEAKWPELKKRFLADVRNRLSIPGDVSDEMVINNFVKDLETYELSNDMLSDLLGKVVERKRKEQNVGNSAPILVDDQNSKQQGSNPASEATRSRINLGVDEQRAAVRNLRNAAPDWKDQPFSKIIEDFIIPLAPKVGRAEDIVDFLFDIDELVRGVEEPFKDSEELERWLLVELLEPVNG